jgi:hypothetical protein
MQNYEGSFRHCPHILNCRGKKEKFGQGQDSLKSLNKSTEKLSN